MELSPWKKNMGVRLQVKRITSDLILHPEVESDQQRRKLRMLLKIMRAFSADRVILQLCLKSLCQISMNPILVERFVFLGCHKDIALALKEHDDWKVAWFGCSAIWNLTKSEKTRDRLDKDTVDAIFFTLEAHQTNSKIVSTCLTALSELGLNEFHRKGIATEKRIDLMFEIIRKNSDDGDVVTSACTLITSLATESRIANQMVQKQVLSLIFLIANNWFSRRMVASTNHFHRKLANSLLQLSTRFPKEIVRNRLIEVLFQIHDHSQGDVRETCALTFLHIAPKIQFLRTTSLHIASALGWLKEVKYLLNIHGANILSDLDYRSKTAIDTSCKYKSFRIVCFFSFAGIEFDYCDPKVRRLIKQGKMKMSENERKFALALQPLQIEIAYLVLSFGTRLERALMAKSPL